MSRQKKGIDAAALENLPESFFDPATTAEFQKATDDFNARVAQEQAADFAALGITPAEEKTMLRDLRRLRRHENSMTPQAVAAESKRIFAPLDRVKR